MSPFDGVSIRLSQIWIYLTFLITLVRPRAVQSYLNHYSVNSKVNILSCQPCIERYIDRSYRRHQTHKHSKLALHHYSSLVSTNAKGTDNCVISNEYINISTDDSYVRSLSDLSHQRDETLQSQYISAYTYDDNNTYQSKKLPSNIYLLKFLYLLVYYIKRHILQNLITIALFLRQTMKQKVTRRDQIQSRSLDDNTRLASSSSQILPSLQYVHVDWEKLHADGITPILAFVNRKSGGLKGDLALKNLQKVLNHIQICDLSRNNIIEFLKFYKNATTPCDLKIICCGGDGTIGWIMDEVYNMKLHHNRTISYGLIPFGTGNDLFIHVSRLTSDMNRFSRMFSANQLVDKTQNVLRLFNDVDQPSVELDRWSVAIAPKTRRIKRFLIRNISKRPRKLRHQLPGDNQDEDDDNTSILTASTYVSSVDSNVHRNMPTAVATALDASDETADVILRDISSYIDSNQSSNIDGDRFNERLSASSSEGSRGFGMDSSFVMLDSDSMTSANPERSPIVNWTKKFVNTIKRYAIPRQIRVAYRRLKYKAIKQLKRKKPPKVKVLNNYMGIGVDGSLAMNFSDLRRRVPMIFFHALINKAWYGLLGIVYFLFGMRFEINKSVKLSCDGVPCDIPDGVQGIIINNIKSYAGGCTLWKFDDEKWKSQKANDGTIEVCGHTETHCFLSIYSPCVHHIDPPCT